MKKKRSKNLSSTKRKSFIRWKHNFLCLVATTKLIYSFTAEKRVLFQETLRYRLERNRVEQNEKNYPYLICTQSLGHVYSKRKRDTEKEASAVEKTAKKVKLSQPNKNTIVVQKKKKTLSPSEDIAPDPVELSVEDAKANAIEKTVKKVELSQPNKKTKVVQKKKTLSPAKYIVENTAKKGKVPPQPNKKARVAQEEVDVAVAEAIVPVVEEEEVEVAEVDAVEKQTKAIKKVKPIVKTKTVRRVKKAPLLAADDDDEPIDEDGRFVFL